jgi:thiol-disulfide isomerase/thioredoxin
MADSKSLSNQQLGDKVPEFELPLVGGATRTLSFFLSGKRGAVVVFWSGTCSHCMRYDGYFNQMATKYPQIGFVAVASRSGEDLSQIRAAIEDRSLRFPIFRDSDGLVAKRWFAQQTPRAFLIDSDRRLLYRGAIDNFKFPEDPEYRPYLDPAIEAFLSGKAISRRETASFGCAVESVYYLLPKPLA